MSSPVSPSQEAYTPAIPSPLNPFSLETPAPRRHGRCASSRPRAVRKPGGPISPTQRLMRQKAAAAYVTQRNAVLDGPYPPFPASLSPPLGNQPDIASREGNIEEADIVDDGQHGCSRLGIVDENCHEMGLGIVMMDMEKQALVGSCEEFGTVPIYDSEHAYRPPRRSRILTKERVLVAAGILCVVGLLSAMRSRGTSL
ncbi:uncharacterized protein BCR38DRAFT_485994 [Pseudomassariella vexata]|uniref:Uncharacterized protein n=1 Tax=Pseudomassariella vexata TaxID=1141098 RepID=A0A1Y2DVG1_9PEZI|nr:uncharacterized protein BCR38DRAFT_485994 [Pseudomassariella vexata]ORY63238.1 hypothetical protein BCR38DRAFT_485994 [Pseudomassariella vexata]